MHYTDDDQSCKVNFFRESGKWYCTEAVRFLESHYRANPRDAFEMALRNHLNGTRLNGMWAVCLEPFHEHPYPMMIKVGDWKNLYW